jgi:hypothetical protein
LVFGGFLPPWDGLQSLDCRHHSISLLKGGSSSGALRLM